MALHVVLLPMILAVSLATTECCASSPGSRMDLHLHSQKDASGHWIIRVDAQRSVRSKNEREVIIDVHQETRLSRNNEMEQVVSMTTVYPPLNDTWIEPSTTTTTAATLSTATATPSTTTTPTTTTTPKSCPPDEIKTWSEARDQCVGDGGDLMVMETERERQEVYIPLYESVRSSAFYPWVGVYKLPDEDSWMSVNGEPALSTWWGPGEPDGNAARKCAYAISSGLLENYNCTTTTTFICEISL